MATTTLRKPANRDQSIERPETRSTGGPGGPQKASRILPLDGVRALAIIGVVLYHFHVPHFKGGFVGVNVFFVLSGYLITSLLLSEQAKTGAIKLGRFWARRVLRLYPTLIAVVVVGASLWFLVGDDGTTKNLSAGGAALIALTYTGNFMRAFGHVSQGVFAPSWSLAMEEQFYLVWPPILLFLVTWGLRRRTIAWGLAVLVVVSSALGWMLYTTPGTGATPDIYFSPVSNVAPLLTGCVLALALTHERVKKLFSGWFGAVATYAGFAAIVAVLFSITSSDWGQEAPFFGVVLPGVGVAAGLLIGGLVSRPSLLGSALALRPIAWFGRNVSYSFYLWHVLVMSLLLPLMPGLVGKFLVIGAAVVVAIASHFVIERPFLTIKKRFEPASWSSGASTAAPTAKHTEAGRATV